MLHVFLFLVLDSILYGLITWYVDGIHPGWYGVPKPLYFPCTKRYWYSADEGCHQNEACPLDYGDRREYFEQYDNDLKPGIQIRNLTKIYNQGKDDMKAAVCNMSIDMLQGQITCLLGHNGAGKTTTISILTGFLQPTSGTAYMSGYNIVNEMDKVRRNLGFCPQNDVLFDTLTVEEHLIFYTKLRGMNKIQSAEEVGHIIRDVDLQDKCHTEARHLSGGQRRKLSVAIALVAGPRLVILDEPSSGMDPEARRQIWDLLKMERSGRTILLTTHSMDEADYLGDRIAIMAGGTIQCCGSSIFLKNKYGVGYHLITVKEECCDVKRVINKVKSFVPEAELESNIGAELSFALPRHRSGTFHELFTFLENNCKELGISSYGSSITTLEEVFLKVGQGTKEFFFKKLQNGYKEEELSATNASTLLGRRNEGRKLRLQQFRAMLVKRMIYTVRNKLSILAQTLIPVAFAIAACSVLLAVPGLQDPPAYNLTVDHFNDPIAPYLTVADNCTTIVDDLAASYLDTLLDTNVRRTPLVNGQEPYSNETTMDEFLTGEAIANLDEYTRDQMTAATFAGGCGQRTTVTGHFNNEAYHTPAISLGIVLNAMVKYAVNASHQIHVINHPLPRDIVVTANEQLTTIYMSGYFVAYITAFGLAFSTSTFVLFVVEERQVKSKLIQFVSGLPQAVYWSSSFVWDLINYFLTAVLLLSVYVAFQIDAYSTGEGVAVISATFVLYGWAILPSTYLFSFVFDTPSAAYRTLTLTNIISGTAAIVIVTLLKTSGLVDVGTALEWTCYALMPNFAFGSILGELFINYESKRMCTSMETELNQTLEEICSFSVTLNVTNPCCYDNCGSWCAYFTESLFAFPYPGAGRGLLFLSCQGFLFFLALFTIDSDWTHHLKSRTTIRTKTGVQATEVHRESCGHNAASDVDRDVLVEQIRIRTTPLDELVAAHALVLRNLTKTYGSFKAVDNLSIGVNKGEVFGLLGVNGAGKTTTFKMLTGDETISAGDAFLEGHSVTTDMKKIRQRIGYCPQFDALIGKMTVEETLRMYARLRGYAEEDIDDVIDELVKVMHLTSHAGVLAKDLSGGNRRKLSTAIALIGDPPVAFLDEPTTGMDPVARRVVWDALTKVCARGRTIVLTSHSMEECEALCNRLVIMVNGSLQCLGSIQQIKSKFGEGYTLTAKLRTEENSVSVGSSTRMQENTVLQQAGELITNGKDEEFLSFAYETSSKSPRFNKSSDSYISHIDKPNKQTIDLRTQQLKSFIEASFPGARLTEEHAGFVQYEINKTSVSWADLFRRMEHAKDELDLEDYSVSQTSLEQIFLNFARHQRAPVEKCQRPCFSADSCSTLKCRPVCNCFSKSKTLPISG